MWTPEERKAERKKFYNKLRFEQVLDYSKEEDKARYVEQLHGNSNAVERLFQAIDMSDGEGVFLFSGQSGSGKSTELLRLKSQLIEADANNKVFYLDLNDYLNPSQPIEISGFTLAVLGAWLEALDDALRPNFLSRLTDFFKTTEVDFKELNIVGLKISLRSDNVFLDKLTSVVRAHKTGFRAWLQEFVINIHQHICPNGEKCILLIDSLEKITGTPGVNSREVHESVLALFSQHSEALQLPLIQTVYSIPHMVLSLNQQLLGNLGGAVAVNLPSVHIFLNNSNDADVDTLDKMLLLISKTYPDYREFIGDEVIKYFAEKSGGKLRQFIQAVRHCLTHSTVLTDKITDINAYEVSSALAQIKPTAVIKKEIWEWLVKIDQSHTAELNGNIDAFVLNEYLDSQHVLVYLNGTAWYGVHPLLRDDLEAFKTR